MDANEYLELLHEDAAVISLSHYDESGFCDGRGLGLIIDDAECIAVMLEPCGNPLLTQVDVGAIGSFARHPEAPPKIIGRPAYVSKNSNGPTQHGMPLMFSQIL